MKRLCTICALWKEEEEYFKNARAKDGLMKHCKKCHYIMSRRWEKENREIRREQRRRARVTYASLHPDRIRAQNKRAREKHREVYASRKRAYYKKVREDSITSYGGKCVCCGEDNMKFLSLDHKNNDGNIHRKSLKSSLPIWARDNGYPDTLQVLCFNCNLGKALNNLVCPHQEMGV